jgi:hypothetical protein
VVSDEPGTDVPGVSALADHSGKGAFTHASCADFKIVAARLLDQGRRKVSDRIAAHNVYIDPPPGRSGLTEAQIRRAGRRTLIGRGPTTRVSPAVEKSKTQGLMKILVDTDTKETLEAAVLGTGGGEGIHCVPDVMYAKTDFDDAVTDLPMKEINRQVRSATYTIRHLLEHMRRTQNDVLQFVIDPTTSRLSSPLDTGPRWTKWRPQESGKNHNAYRTPELIWLGRVLNLRPIKEYRPRRV